MSVRSFHSVFMATAVAGAALGCYLVSLRVASERAALEQVESEIISTQADIRMLQTEIGTRARLTQLERWNVRALALSAPSAGQILGDKFQLARLVSPERKPALEAPVVLASAPAPQPQQPLAQDGDAEIAPAGELLHQASYEVPEKVSAPAKNAQPQHKAAEASNAAKQAAKKPDPKPAKVAEATASHKAGDKPQRSADATVTKPVRTAKVDPLAPLPAAGSKAEALRTQR